MSTPKSILKKPHTGPPPRAGPSVPRTGSKLRHTLAVASPRQHTKAPPASKGKIPNVARHEDDDEDDEDESDDSMGDDPDSRADVPTSGAMGIDVDEHGDGEEDDGADEDGPDTEDELDRIHSKGMGKKAAPKRKAPMTAETFGSTLTSLLSEPSRPPRPSKRTKPDPSETQSTLPSAPTPAQIVQRAAATTTTPLEQSAPPTKLAKPTKPLPAPILSLSRAPLPPTKSQVSLERKAARALKAAKQEREDRARVKDVVEGWSQGGGDGLGVGGMEFERGLRKTAQRGVIKLFNAILVASKASEAGDIPLATRAGVRPDKAKPGEKDNVLGRGGREELTKEGFLDLVRRGGK